MSKEAVDQPGPSADSIELLLDAGQELIDGSRRTVAHSFLGIAMTVLLRIELRTVSRQGLNVDLSVAVDVLTNDRTGVGFQTIPDDDHRPFEIAPDVPQRRDDPWSIDRSLEVDRVDPARGRQAAEAGESPALVFAFEHGCSACLGPCCCHTVTKADAELITEDDDCAT